MFRTGISRTGLLLAFSVVSVSHAEPLEFYYQRGMKRMMAAKARIALEADPDNIDLMSMYAINWARAGFYADAASAFQFCDGSPRYEQDGLILHADALREVGQPLSAVHLRQSQRIMAPQAEQLLLLGIADDYMSAGMLDEAAEQLDEALWLFPQSANVLAALAEVSWLRGDTDAVTFYLWRIEHNPQMRSVRTQLVKTRLLLEEGAYEEASRILRAAREASPHSMRLVALDARLLRLQGDPQAALELLSRRRWSFHERPDLMMEKALAYHGTGQHSLAQELLDRLRRLYPHHATVTELSAIVEGEQGTD